MNQPAEFTAEALYNLLPAVYRQRDVELGQPLQALLSVISEQVGIVQDDIANLYENWFIETCDPWVVPYIGDLVGATLRRTDTTGIVNRRSFVANTISYRRRKGTLLVMEDLARDITGCGAKAVEFFKLLETTQNFNHVRSSNFRTPDLRNTCQLELLNTPFDSIAHSLEVRNISSRNGRYNVPNVGIFLYRLLALPVTNAPARPVDATNQHFTFDTLGRDVQLFNHPVTESGPPAPAKPIDVAIPIRRLALSSAPADYYGADKSFEITLVNSANGTVVPAESITVCDLTDWIHTPEAGPAGSSMIVAVDPVLGRIAFSQPPTGDVYVSYHYGFSAEMGGGFYERPDPDPYADPTKSISIYPIKKGGTYPIIQDAFNAWVPTQNQYVIFEIEDSEVYSDPINITLPAGSFVEIRAAQETRPIIKTSGNVQVTGATPAPNYPGASLVINGLMFDCPIDVQSPSPMTFEKIPNNPSTLVSLLQSFGYSWANAMQFALNPEGNTITGSMPDGSHSLTLTLTANEAGAVLVVDGSQIYTFPSTLQSGAHNLTAPRGLAAMTFRHCTLIPGQPAACLTVDAGNDDLLITFDSSISGSIDTSACEATLQISSSIIDGSNNLQAVACYELNTDSATILGGVNVTLVGILSNSIFRDVLIAKRRQTGCVRFCYLPTESRVPHRYRCQPGYSPAGASNAETAAALLVTPRFTSTNYGDPGYAQLYKYTQNELFEGADDGNEMGAFNSLKLAARFANLNSTVSDYTRFGLQTGIFMVT